jgi:hypothetical protein
MKNMGLLIVFPLCITVSLMSQSRYGKSALQPFGSRSGFYSAQSFHPLVLALTDHTITVAESI